MDEFDRELKKYDMGGKNESRYSGNGGNKFFRKMTLVMVGLCVVVTLCIAISVVTSIASRDKSSDAGNASEKLINVSVKEMKGETFRETISLNAELKSRNGAVVVTAPVAGTLTDNIVYLGDRVKKGDMLGVLDASDVGVSYKVAPVYAKADGVITAVSGVVNQKVAVASPLYTIEPDPDYVLNASVSEKDADSVDMNALGLFTTAGNRENMHTAHVRYIAPSVTVANRTVAIELEVDKEAQNLKGLRSGNYVDLELINREFENVFVVPKDAVKTYLGEDVVYVIGSDNIAHRVSVQQGNGNESYVIITSGLNTGDVVVVQGSPQDGDKVQIL